MRKHIVIGIAVTALSCGLNVCRSGHHTGWQFNFISPAHAQQTCEYPPQDEGPGMPGEPDGDECNPKGQAPIHYLFQLFGMNGGFQLTQDGIIQQSWDTGNNNSQPPLPPPITTQGGLGSNQGGLGSNQGGLGSNQGGLGSNQGGLGSNQGGLGSTQGGVGSGGGSGHLGMYISPSSPLPGLPGWSQGWGGWGGGSVVKSSGYNAIDGILPPGTPTNSVKTTNGYGGIYGIYDASGMMPTGQALLFLGSFNFGRADSTLGPTPGLAASSSGSARIDDYTFLGSVLWGIGTTYVRGMAGFGWQHGNEDSAVDSSSGSFSGANYVLDLKVGKEFLLFSNVAAPSRGIMPTKAPPKQSNGYWSGYWVGLDLSGHVGYNDGWFNGFTDNSGFIFGKAEIKYTDLGARARLFALVSGNGLLWTPFVSGTVDHLYGFSSSLTLPSQFALPAGDFISIQPALTFWGTDFGVNVQAPTWSAGVKGFYLASSDTTIAGGEAYIKFPFNWYPYVRARY